MPDISRVQTTQNLLKALYEKRSIEPLKQLFWTHLDYQRVNRTLSRKDWPESTVSVLAEDPVLFATGGEQFEVIYCRLKSDKLLLTDERPVITRLLQNHPYAIFVFSNSKQDRWHFANVKYEEETDRRRVFRRFTIGAEEQLRTAAERLDMVTLSGMRDLAPIAIQKLHDDAFDVEPVTKEFFKEYRRLFEEVENSVKGITDKERKRLFAQRLFNRIMFIAFIQKKGWLKFNGSTDYLNALWKAYKADKTVSDSNFYRDRLKPLFFFGLNSSNEVNQIGINRGAFLKTLIGDVPYLNGGLFEEDEDDKNSKILVPDQSIDSVLNQLFAKFNFTVTESTPLDVEVAVDPEMLGKIFEELVTGRHETGSYYTPKPIVSFMCREAIEAYLQQQIQDESRQALHKFVWDHNPSGLKNGEVALEALKRITACDPACGSGAYLVGMLHELLEMRAVLFATKQLDSKSVYDRKLEIIQRNLYGVDLDTFAVNIARLRLWLSLSVEFEGTNPPPLPNLDYKIEVGDSLAAPSPGGGTAGLRQTSVEKYFSVKQQFLISHDSHKRQLRAEIERLKLEITAWTHPAPVQGFDWAVEFAEIFAQDGFDIVVANPPYISALEFRRRYSNAYREHLNRSFITARGAYDIYVLFFERALSLLKRGGFVAFINPNKYLSASYASSLRAFMLENSQLLKIIDLSSVDVFQNVSVYPVLTFLRRTDEPEVNDVLSLIPENRGDDDPETYRKSLFSGEMLRRLPENIWGFLLSSAPDLLLKMISGANPLANLGHINATSTAAESDTFTPYIIPKAKKGALKIINTGTIDPFVSLWGKAPMTHTGQKFLTPYLDVAAAPITDRRLKMYRSPKIIFAKMARTCEAFFDRGGEYASINTNCFYEPVKRVDFDYVAAFCGSRVFMFLYNQFFGALRMSGGYYQFQSPQLRVIPLRDCEQRKKVEIGKLLQTIEANGYPSEERDTLLGRVDQIFYEIYDLDADDISVIESS